MAVAALLKYRFFRFIWDAWTGVPRNPVIALHHTQINPQHILTGTEECLTYCVPAIKLIFYIGRFKSPTVQDLLCICTSPQMLWIRCIWLATHLSTRFCPHTERNATASPNYECIPSTLLSAALTSPSDESTLLLSPMDVAATVLVPDSFGFHPKIAHCTQLLKEEVLSEVTRQKVSFPLGGAGSGSGGWGDLKKKIVIPGVSSFSIGIHHSTNTSKQNKHHTGKQAWVKKRVRTSCFKHCTNSPHLFPQMHLPFTTIPGHSGGAPAPWLSRSRWSHASVELQVSGHTSLMLYLLAHSITTNGFFREEWEGWRGAGASENHLQLLQRTNDKFTENWVETALRKLPHLQLCLGWWPRKVST